MDINTIIFEYLKAKEEKAAAEKREKAFKALLIDHAKGRDNFTTDIFTVIVKTTMSSRLDTAALYKDFPDIKSVYEKQTTSTTVTAVYTDNAEQKTA